MDYFALVEDAQAIICDRSGTYRQVDLAVRTGKLYAQTSKGRYVRLLQSGSTSSSRINWYEIDIAQGYHMAHGSVWLGRAELRAAE